MNNEATVRFSRVLTTQNHDGWLKGILLFILICYFDQWHIDASIGLSNAREFNELKWGGLCNFFDLPEMALHLSVSIGHCVCHVYLVHLIVKFEVEAHCVVTLGLMWIHLVDLNMVR
jgi:hypothetical protein